jgi:heme/copper-type cytochrome/quinol oxidase subunit 1
VLTEYSSQCILSEWLVCQEDIIPIPLFDDLQDVNVLITTFALVGGVFQVVFLFNFFYSMFYGKKSVQNPWRSNTLEWTALLNIFTVTGQEKFKYTDGHMITVNLVLREDFVSKRTNATREEILHH